MKIEEISGGTRHPTHRERADTSAPPLFPFILFKWSPNRSKGEGGGGQPILPLPLIPSSDPIRIKREPVGDQRAERALLWEFLSARETAFRIVQFFRPSMNYRLSWHAMGCYRGFSNKTLFPGPLVRGASRNKPSVDRFAAWANGNPAISQWKLSNNFSSGFGRHAIEKDNPRLGDVGFAWTHVKCRASSSYLSEVENCWKNEDFRWWGLKAIKLLAWYFGGLKVTSKDS